LIGVLIILSLQYINMGFWSGLMMWFSTLFKKKSQPTKLTLPPPGNGGLGQTAVIKGKLVRQSNMAPIPNASVVVTVTDPTAVVVTSTKVTDAQGMFSVSIPLLKLGSYVVKADYAGGIVGTIDYKPSSGQTTVTALPAPVPTTLTLTPSATSGVVGTTITINATLQG
jgi:hypothetical protein